MQEQGSAGSKERNRERRRSVTPDGRYFVVRGRLWRCSNPELTADTRKTLVAALMKARRDKGVTLRSGDAVGQEKARRAVDAAKQGLGERGPVWWSDEAPDLNRHMVRNTTYAAWFAELNGGIIAGESVE